MPDEFRQILGLRFYVGDFAGLLDRTMAGGMIVVPSAPVLVDLADHPAHREALEHSDFAITDSAFMVLLWLVLQRERLPRISGLRYLRGLVGRPEFREPNATFWVMPSAEDAQGNCAWLRQQGILVGSRSCYIAPFYPDGPLEDAALLAQIELAQPRFVILCVRGGVQERVAYFLKTRLPAATAFICTGGAIAFLSGRQTSIPVWADRLFLGWLLRLVNSPKSFSPRLWKSLRLVALLGKYGANRPAAPSRISSG
jgi:N-acetylglucosaminyldiphosphoundecaprenol N-acetyl-beta-D-mannosaminyltransferase